MYVTTPPKFYLSKVSVVGKTSPEFYKKLEEFCGTSILPMSGLVFSGVIQFLWSGKIKNQERFLHCIYKSPLTAYHVPIIMSQSSVQFSSVSQSCPTLRPHESLHARPPCLSPTPRVYPNPCPSSR